MICKTDAIVLDTRKFGETSLISAMYTREYGRRSFLVKGYRSASARKRHSYFQPMSIIEVIFYQKDTRELQLVSESHNRHFFHSLQTDPVKITLGMLVAEIFYMTVKEEEKNPTLFDFLARVLIELDNQDKHLIHIFLYYLLHLSGHLGFFPADHVEDPALPIHFDLRNGILTNASMSDKGAALALAFARSSLLSCQTIPVSKSQKTELIDTMMEYYRLHVEGFKVPQSLEILREVFGG